MLNPWQKRIFIHTCFESMERIFPSFKDNLNCSRWPRELRLPSTQTAAPLTPPRSKDGGKGLQSGGFWGKEMTSGAKHAGLRWADSRQVGSVQAWWGCSDACLRRFLGLSGTSSWYKPRGNSDLERVGGNPTIPHQLCLYGV